MASSPLTAAGFQPAQEENRRGLGSLVLLFVLPAVIFGGLVAYSQFSPTKAAAPKQGTPGSLVWGDGNVIFSNKQQLAAWLRLHGSNYRAFVKRHPEALRLVTSRPRKRVVPASTKQAVKHAPSTPVAAAKTTPAVKVTPAPLVVQGSEKNGTKTLVLRIAAALGILAALFALLPPALLRRVGVGSSGLELRFGAAAVGVAILAGLGFGMLIG